jgi:hypothetical protein
MLEFMMIVITPLEPAGGGGGIGTGHGSDEGSSDGHNDTQDSSHKVAITAGVVTILGVLVIALLVLGLTRCRARRTSGRRSGAAVGQGKTSLQLLISELCPALTRLPDTWDLLPDSIELEVVRRHAVDGKPVK